MVDYIWNGLPGPVQDASVAGNWLPSGPPSAADNAVFNNPSASACNFNIAAVNEIRIDAAFDGLIFGNNVALAGLSSAVDGMLQATTAVELTFSGTAPHNSGKSHILLSGDGDPFNNATSRSNITFKIQASSTPHQLPCGHYPHLKLSQGDHAPNYVDGGSTDKEVRFLSLTVESTVSSFAPLASAPSSDDKALKWISDGGSSQFSVSIATFDGGEAEWTFQGYAQGGTPFTVPTDGTGADFTFKKMVIDSTANGAGAIAKVSGGGILILQDLTINSNAIVVGDDTLGSAIHLINRPKLKGSWSFHPIADGIYHHKSNHTLGVAHGGTGLQSLDAGRIPFGKDGLLMDSDAKLTWTKSSSTLTVNGKLTVTGLIDPTGMEFTAVGSNPGTDAAKTIWVNSGDSNKLYFGSSEIGGGGGGGTVDVVSNVATNTILGRNDSGSGNSEELTPAEVRTMLNVEDGADVTDATNVTAAGALMDSEVTNLAQVKAFNSADYATAAQGVKADSALQDPAQFATAAQGILAESAIQPGQYEAGSTPISAKGFIDTGTDTSWIAQSSGSRAAPAANGAGSSQVFSNSTTTVVTAWNQDLVTTQGITYSSGIWTIDTAGIYEVHAKFAFLDGDASGSNTLGNPSSTDFIQSIAHIVYTSDGSTPGASDILVRGPVMLFTNGTGLSAKGCEVRTVRRFDAADKIAFAVFNRLQSNQSTSKKYRLRSGYYNECSIRRIG